MEDIKVNLSVLKDLYGYEDITEAKLSNGRLLCYEKEGFIISEYSEKSIARLLYDLYYYVETCGYWVRRTNKNLYELCDLKTSAIVYSVDNFGKEVLIYLDIVEWINQERIKDENKRCN